MNPPPPLPSPAASLEGQPSLAASRDTLALLHRGLARVASLDDIQPPRAHPSAQRSLAACPPAHLPVAPLLTDFSPCCPAADSARCRVGQDTFIKVIIGCTVAAAAWAIGSDALGLDAGKSVNQSATPP